MRSRYAFFALALVVSALALPLAAHATGIPFFGPIVPPGAATCAAGWGAVADLVNRGIAFLITLLILFVAPFMIAWAGFLYVVSPTSPAMRSKASAILLNTAIGIAVALAAWLIVNALLVALTTKGVANWTDAMFTTTESCLLETSAITKPLSEAAGQMGVDTGSCPEGSTKSGSS